MSLVAVNHDHFELGVGDTFLDVPSGLQLTLLDTRLAEDGSAWCATQDGVQFDCPLPEGWILSDKRLENADYDLVDQVMQWAVEGRHHALYWLSQYYAVRDTPKSVWMLIAAYRLRPEEYRDLFHEARLRHAQNPGGDSPEFVLDIPEFTSSKRRSVDWRSALKRAEAL